MDTPSPSTSTQPDGNETTPSTPVMPSSLNTTPSLMDRTSPSANGQSTPAQGLNLGTLPAEMMGFIFEQLQGDHNDMSSLRRTSRKLFGAGRKQMYRNTLIGASAPVDLLSPENLHDLNEGLPDIRELEVGPLGDTAPGNEDWERQFIRDVLRVNNMLETLDVSNLILDEPTFSAIVTSSWNLQSLALGHLPFHLSLNACARLSSECSLSKLHSLQIPSQVCDGFDFQSYNLILYNAPDLRTLYIRKIVDLPLEPELEYAPDTPIAEIFQLPSHWKKDRLDLEVLVLEDVGLDAAWHFLTRRIAFTVLGRFDLNECGQDETLMQNLVEASMTSGCNLHSFRIESDQMNTNLCDFIGSFSGLRRLYILAHDIVSAFNFNCLLGHVHNLEEFAVALTEVCDCPGCLASHVPYVAPFIAFARSCSNLKQLAIPMPGVKIRQSDGDNEDEGTGSDNAPADTSEYDDDPAMQEYNDTISSLLALPNLDILRLTSYPRAPCGTFVPWCENVKPFDHEADDEMEDEEYDEENDEIGDEEDEDMDVDVNEDVDDNMKENVDGESEVDNGTDRNAVQRNINTYLRLLDSFATRLLRRHSHHRRMPVICFGAHGHYFVCDGAIPQFAMRVVCYVEADNPRTTQHPLVARVEQDDAIRRWPAFKEILEIKAKEIRL